MNKDIKQIIGEIVNKYEMTGAYIEGAKRVDYKHFTQDAKDKMVNELTTLLQNSERELLKKLRTDNTGYPVEGVAYAIMDSPDTTPKKKVEVLYDIIKTFDEKIDDYLKERVR